MFVLDKTSISNTLSEITNHLIINGSMVLFSGLLYGKLGISLFFFHYARYTGNSLYDEYARYLVYLVKTQLNEDYPLDYERGLSGVGTGFNYLKKQRFLDIGDDLMLQIDSKIIKAINFETRKGLLTGFGRYLLSRYENHPTMKKPLTQLVNIHVNNSEQTQNNDFLSLLCDLYLLGVEKVKIKLCLKGSMDILIEEVQKEPISEKLLTLIKLSKIPSCCLCQKVINEVLKNVFSKKNNQFADINDLQWLLRCEKLLKDKEYHSFVPKVNQIIASFPFPTVDRRSGISLDDLFSSNQNFAFQGGYAGLGLALILILSPETIFFINLLNKNK